MPESLAKEVSVISIRKHQIINNDISIINIINNQYRNGVVISVIMKKITSIISSMAYGVMA